MIFLDKNDNRVLVHICCSVDSHYFLSELQKAYPDKRFVGYFYNPNIHPRSEYDLRLLDVQRSCKMLDIELIEGEYELEEWLCGVKGLEDEPEKGARCVNCFDIRLQKTAKVALQNKIPTFSSTLLSSPMKEQQILFAEGDRIAEAYGLSFLKIDVRSKGGTQKQSELANKDRLYKQNYCGCQFALLKQREAQNQLPLELMSDIGGQILPGSNEQRMSVFAQRNECEQNGKDYVLYKKSVIIWRDLRSYCLQNGIVIDSYIVAHSRSKNGVKTSDIVYIKHFCPNFGETISLGYAKKDESVFICLDDLNKIWGTGYKSVREMVYKPPLYERELELRDELCGRDSTNPIVILDHPQRHSLKIYINAHFQEGSIFAIAMH